MEGVSTCRRLFFLESVHLRFTFLNSQQQNIYRQQFVSRIRTSRWPHQRSRQSCEKWPSNTNSISGSHGSRTRVKKLAVGALRQFTCFSQGAAACAGECRWMALPRILVAGCGERISKDPAPAAIYRGRFCTSREAHQGARGRAGRQVEEKIASRQADISRISA